MIRPGGGAEWSCRTLCHERLGGSVTRVDDLALVAAG
jgi:hypothetical protein